MQLNISHTTVYRFDEPALYGLQQLRLTPKSRPGQQEVAEWVMQVDGGRVEAQFVDQHQNQVTLMSFSPDAREVRVVCEGIVHTSETAGVIGKHAGYAPLWFFQRTTPLTRAGARVQALCAGLRDEFGGEFGGDLPLLHALSARILDAVPYEIGRTGSETSAEGAAIEGAGVCQDHAHIFLAAARLLGFPARYVSGYLMMNDRVHQDASHAWAEAHVEGIGWVGFDISNGYSPDPRYVRVATGLDYGEAAPVHGLHYGASGEAMSVDIQVAQQ